MSIIMASCSFTLLCKEKAFDSKLTCFNFNNIHSLSALIGTPALSCSHPVQYPMKALGLIKTGQIRGLLYPLKGVMCWDAFLLTLDIKKDLFFIYRGPPVSSDQSDRPRLTLSYQQDLYHCRSHTIVLSFSPSCVKISINILNTARLIRTSLALLKSPRSHLFSSCWGLMCFK